MNFIEIPLAAPGRTPGHISAGTLRCFRPQSLADTVEAFGIGTWRWEGKHRVASDIEPKMVRPPRARKIEIRQSGQRDARCPVVARKIFRLTRRANQRYQLARLTRQEGRLAIVTNVRWDAVDAQAATDERSSSADGEVVWSWRPDAGAKSCGLNICKVTVARKPGHRGELEVSRKPLRREGRIASAEPVCSCALSFVHFAHETAGAARTRSSLRPLFSEEQDSSNYPGDPRRGNAELYPLFDDRRAGAAFAPLASAGFELSVDLRSVLTVTR